MERLLTPQEVATLLGVSTSWVYANKGALGYVMIGTAVRFDSADIERYAQSRKRGPQHEERKWESQSDTGKAATSGSSRRRTTVSDINARLKATGRAKSRHANTPPHAKLQ